MELQIILMRGGCSWDEFSAPLEQVCENMAMEEHAFIFLTEHSTQSPRGHVSVRRKVLGEVTLPVKPSQGPGTTADGDLVRKRLWPRHRCA